MTEAVEDFGANGVFGGADGIVGADVCGVGWLAEFGSVGVVEVVGWFFEFREAKDFAGAVAGANCYGTMVLVKYLREEEGGWGGSTYSRNTSMYIRNRLLCRAFDIVRMSIRSNRRACLQLFCRHGR